MDNVERTSTTIDDNPMIRKDSVFKSADLGVMDVTDDMMIEINKHTLVPLTKDEVFVFKIMVVDNEWDRMDTRFPAKEVKRMAKLFVGKTMIKDHYRSADNQVARIFRTDIEEGAVLKEINEPLTSLIAHAYVLVTSDTENLIKDIRGGIKKEVSLNVSVSEVVCSICGVNKVDTYCSHRLGDEYDGEICRYVYKGVKDAHEVSFVAVPAFKNAGVIKHLVEKNSDPVITEKPEDDTDDELVAKNNDTLRLSIEIAKEYLELHKVEK